MGEQPSVIQCIDGDWLYYVRASADRELDLWQVDDPAVLDCERVWLRPIPLSSIPPDDRGELDSLEALERGRDGRFRSVYISEECGENALGAEAYWGVRYKPATSTHERNE